MIPADVASRLRLVTQEQPAPPQPATPGGKLADVLSDLVPGQRLMAEIQALLPNGTYRAIVAQRDVTLALPFSAKPGDSLELEVVESDGKLSLAFVANRNPAKPDTAASESVATNLSPTGKLIGNLLGNIEDQGKRPQAMPLNGNEPLLKEFPKDAAQLAPVLKEALSQSGMFYEAHQVRWVEGKMPTAALLQEPQGKLSRIAEQPPAPQAARTDNVGSEAGAPPAKEAPATAAASADSLQKLPPQPPLPADLAPLVRQQLDALATQNYIWQGQIWPGQQMHWEIEEDRSDRQGAEEAGEQQWQTRLKLTLPGLGGIAAVLRLRPGGAIDLSLVTDKEQSRQTLIAAGEGLRRQLDDAGLNLSAFAVQHGEAAD